MSTRYDLAEGLSAATSDAVDQLKSQLESLNSQLAKEQRMQAAQKQQIEELEARLRTSAAASTSAPSVKVEAPAPAKAEKEEEQSGGAFGLLNMLGIVAGGGLGGYVFVLNRNKQVSGSGRYAPAGRQFGCLAEI